MGARDLPSEAEEPALGARAGDGGAGRSKAREMPDPDERGRAHEAMRAHVSAETREEAGMAPERDRGPEAIDQRSYRAEVPRFQKEWAEHEKRWPARSPAELDRPADSEELIAATSRAFDRAREKEPAISADAQAIQQESKHGGWLEGFDFRLKGEDRLRQKVAEQAESEPGESLATILSKIPDVIRFTTCFQPDNYTRGYYDIKERLESRGYEMFYSKNWWTNPEYKGINTRWIAADGQRFEWQFHTPDSFHAKHCVTHAAYERIHNLATPRRERPELHAFQREVSSHIQVPDGAADIPDFKKEGF